MKANQKHLQSFLREEEAVSPVIAVILMVAITVVLAATVFVLVSDLGGDVGKTGPKLSLVTDTTSSTTKWIVKISDATQSVNLNDYQFIVTAPQNGTFVIDPTETAFTTAVNYVVTSGSSVDTRAAAASGSHTATTTDFQFSFSDVSGDSKFNTLDKVTITYDTTDAATAVDTFPTGTYKLELRHKTTNTATGSVEQGF